MINFLLFSCRFLPQKCFDNYGMVNGIHSRRQSHTMSETSLSNNNGENSEINLNKGVVSNGIGSVKNNVIQINGAKKIKNPS